MVTAPAKAQERGRCATVELGWRVGLPDGSVHHAKSLSLCLVDYWTPVSGLHEISVNGMPLGRFISRAEFSEGASEQYPVMVFSRDSTDTHHLIGYAWPVGDRMRVFALGKNRQIRGSANARINSALTGVDESLVAVAMERPRK